MTPRPEDVALPLAERQAAAAQAAKDYTRKLLAEQKPALAYLISYPLLREVAREHGYALALHGSLTRDFDLVAIPWTDDAAEPEALVAAICERTDLTDTGRGDQAKPHGRRCWTLQGVHGVPHGWVDLSVMPRASRMEGEGRDGERLAEAVLDLWDSRPAVIANDAEYFAHTARQDAKREKVLELARAIAPASSPQPTTTTEEDRHA